MLHEFSPFLCESMDKAFGSEGLNRDVLHHTMEEKVRKGARGESSVRAGTGRAGREQAGQLPWAGSRGFSPGGFKE